MSNEPIKINKKHRLFIEAYDGDVVEALRIAGFEGADSYLKSMGNKLLKDSNIVDAIRQRSLYLVSTAKVIATREERQAFWTSIMRNDDPHARPELTSTGVAKIPENIPLGVRLKASELLGKSETDFVERLDINHNLSISDVIKEAYNISNENIDAIEVEYERLHNKNKPKADVVVDVETEPVGESQPNICESILDGLI